jgi:hypothetical protein
MQIGGCLWFEGTAPQGESLAPGEGPIAHIFFNVDCDAHVDDATTISFVSDSCTVLDTLGNPLSELDLRDGLFTVETGIWSEPYDRRRVVDSYVRSFPNPARSSTVISFALPSSLSSSPISLDIFDSMGRWVASYEPPADNGRGQLRWQGIDQRGFPLPAGVYICTVRSPRDEGSAEPVSTRIILLR